MSDVALIFFSLKRMGIEQEKLKASTEEEQLTPKGRCFVFHTVLPIFLFLMSNRCTFSHHNVVQYDNVGPASTCSKGGSAGQYGFAEHFTPVASSSGTYAQGVQDKQQTPSLNSTDGPCEIELHFP